MYSSQSATSVVSWLEPPTFTFGGQSFRHFFHYHNCGWPPERCTERSVELALADTWLNLVEPHYVSEIGAVTPYYWPRRVADIIDPADGHRLVTRRCSLFDIDFHGRAVLSISTLEHVGTGQYDLPVDPPAAGRALAKIFAEAPQFLITVPVGYNPALDAWLFDQGPMPVDVTARFLVRLSAFQWRQEHDLNRARRPYGELWADSVAVLERGGRI
jgi:hypothetical protein